MRLSVDGYTLLLAAKRALPYLAVILIKKHGIRKNIAQTFSHANNVIRKTALWIIVKTDSNFLVISEKIRRQCGLFLQNFLQYGDVQRHFIHLTNLEPHPPTIPFQNQQRYRRKNQGFCGQRKITIPGKMLFQTASQ